MFWIRSLAKILIGFFQKQKRNKHSPSRVRTSDIIFSFEYVESKSEALGTTVWECTIDRIDPLITGFENIKISSSAEFNQKNFLISSYCALLAATGKKQQKMKTFLLICLTKKQQGNIAAILNESKHFLKVCFL